MSDSVKTAHMRLLLAALMVCSVSAALLVVLKPQNRLDLPDVGPPISFKCLRPVLFETGRFTGQMWFEASADAGQTWERAYAIRRPSGRAPVASTTTEGSFYACVEWADQVRVRVSTLEGSASTVVLPLNLLEAQ